MPPLLCFSLRHLARVISLSHVSTLAAGLACAIPAIAQEPGGDGPDGDGPPSTTWSLGVGAISMQKPYTGIDRENQVLPVLLFENRYVHIVGPQIGLKLPSLYISDSQQIDFSIVGKFDGSGYKATDAPILSGMGERKSGFWAGAEVVWKNDLADVKSAWLADASGNSKGQRFSLGVERAWHFGGSMMFRPRAEAIWHDDKYVDYYFGVLDSEAGAGRSAYAGKAGTGAEVGVLGLYMFDPRHSVMLDVAVSSLPKGIKDSPLVDRSTENSVLVGYTYRLR